MTAALRPLPAAAPRPRTRASNVLDFLEDLEVHAPELLASIRSALPLPVRQRIDDAVTSDWLDVEEVHGPYVDAVVAAIGQATAAGLWRRWIGQKIASRPAYRALIAGAATIFGGATVAGFLRMFEATFRHAYRDVAEPRVSLFSREGLVELDLAAPVATHPGYAALFEGILLGVVDMAGAADRCRVDLTVDIKGRRVSARYRW
ncbi:MAG: hypothetical protein QM767_00645 [Anaeromyxobacter sp.]